MICYNSLKLYYATLVTCILAIVLLFMYTEIQSKLTVYFDRNKDSGNELGYSIMNMNNRTHSNTPTPTTVQHEGTEAKMLVTEPENATHVAIGLAGSSSSPYLPKGCDEQFYNSHLMTASFTPGRTGNRVFQYAALLATASRYCYTPYIINKQPLLNDTFNIPPKNFRENIASNTTTVVERGFGIYINESLQTTTNWSLCCYLQSWKYFQDAHELIRSALIFKEDIQRKVERFVQDVKSNANVTLIGVHARRGDMTYGGKNGYVAANITYIEKAMEYYRQKYTDSLFIVASDDIMWCKNSIPGNDVVFSSLKSASCDLALLARCDHVIMTSGTFGWWGAWLSGGTVVYYSGYPRPGSKLREQFNAADYYPPDWIGMQ